MLARQQSNEPAADQQSTSWPGMGSYKDVGIEPGVLGPAGPAGPIRAYPSRMVPGPQPLPAVMYPQQMRFPMYAAPAPPFFPQQPMFAAGAPPLVAIPAQGFFPPPGQYPMMMPFPGAPGAPAPKVYTQYPPRL